MLPIGPERSNVYQTTYRAIVAAGKNRTKASAMHYTRLGEIGTENPMETKMLIKRAKKDYMHDISQVIGDPLNVFLQKINYYKTSVMLQLNKDFRHARQAINNSVKELYPRTYKQREKLIDSGKVSIKSNNDTTTRLKNMKINPDSIIAE